MTTPDQILKIPYLGDDVTAIFAITNSLGAAYLFLDNSSIKVNSLDIVTGIETEVSSGFTVSGEGNPLGGNVTFSGGNEPVSGTKITVFWDGPVDQGADYRKDEGFPSSEHEDQMDEFSRILQNLRELISRAVVFPISTLLTFNSEIPQIPIAKKGIRVNDAGDGLDLTDVDLNDVAVATTASAASAAAALVSENAAAASAAAAVISAASVVLMPETDNVVWSCTSDTQVVIAAGAQFKGVDSDIVFSFGSGVTMDISGTGGEALGLDTGSEAADKWYYLIGLGNSAAPNAASAWFVEASTYAAFVVGDLPAGFTDYAYLGAIRNNGSSNFKRGEFYHGVFTHDLSTQVSVASTGFTNADFSAEAPPKCRRAEIRFFGNAAGSSFWRIDGSSSAGNLLISNSPGVAEVFANVVLSSAQIVEVKISAGSLLMYLNSYVDTLQDQSQ